jgi:Aromatic acid exporter family member 2
MSWLLSVGALMLDWCNNVVTSTMVGMISTALRTGTPLPQITPVPLLDRFLRDHPGLNVLQQEAAEEAGLPRTVTIDTLQDEQYMYVLSLQTSRQGQRDSSAQQVFQRWSFACPWVRIEPRQIDARYKGARG